MEVDTSYIVDKFKRVSEDRILGGGFAEEFSALERKSSGGVYNRLAELYATVNKSELAQGEEKVRRRLGLS